ncbi:Hsp20/alpha crystallin family protein [Algoriphagus jejuensis]
MKRNTRSSYPSFFEDFPAKGLFDWLDTAGIGRTSDSTTLPRVNIVETGADYKVEMAVPGMHKDDFMVQLDNNTLTIQAEKSNDPESEVDGSYTRREFSYSAFRRSFYLPDTVEGDKIEARYLDGILTLVIPKREEAKQKPVRTIQIS